MNRRIFLLSLFLLPFSILATAKERFPVGTWDVIPRPLSVRLISDEKPFVLSEKTVVCLSDKTEQMERNARFLIAAIGRQTGICPTLSTSSRRHPSRCILLGIDTMLARTYSSKEAYRIHADCRSVRIEGASEAGVFHGIHTFIKALETARLEKTKDSKFCLPAVEVEDAPRFPYRGFLIDVSRHFFPVDYLKRVIDILASYHINYFHWHLTDDQGWRIEIKRYPQLLAVGQHRRETLTARDPDVFDGTPVSGFYSQEEARELVRYAAERHVTVIPEIDMPGHSLAALASYPQLGCTGGPYEVECGFGVFDDVLCGGNPEALRFAKDVMEEVMDIFPSPYIHVGGDECPKTRWKQCPKCQAKIAELGLTDRPGHTRENQLQTWFMGELEKEIRQRGRVMVGWDEILDGNPSDAVTVMAWTSPEARLRSARAGHPTVVCPISHFYFSNPYWNRLPTKEGLQRVYDMEPTSPELTDGENARIIGAQGCIWTEWVATPEKLESQLLPRLAALSEVQWSQPFRKDFNNFMERLETSGFTSPTVRAPSQRQP